MPSAPEHTIMFHEGVHRSDAYNYRVPSPPRIVVPPPPDCEDGPDFNIDKLELRSESSAPLDLSFLQPVRASRDTIIAHEWTYNRRREAQQILDFLYLGPMTAARDLEYIRREGITLLLAVRSKQTGMIGGSTRVAHELGIELATIDAENAAALIAAFPRATRTVNDHLARVHEAHRADPQAAPARGKVLVFCESGNERSAAVVVAYLMEMLHDTDYIKAIRLCSLYRFCLNIDDEMRRLLQSYWEVLVAKRAVSATPEAAVGLALEPPAQTLRSAPSTESMRSNSRGKRALEQDDEVMADCSPDPSDLERFKGRAFTPFYS